MTITTKANANGRISGYYVDGVKVRKHEIDGIINSRRDEIITVDYYDGQEFRMLMGLALNQLKVVFTRDDDKIIMTEAAADELGYRVIKNYTGNYYGACLVEKIETPEVEAAMTPEQAVAAKIVETLGNAELEFNFAEEKNNRTVKHFTCKANPAVSIVEVCFDDGAVDYIDINNGEKSLRYDFETDPFKKEIEINPEEYAISPEALDAAVEAETELANVEPTIREKFLIAKEEVRCRPGRYLGNNKFAQKWEQIIFRTHRPISKIEAADLLRKHGLTIKQYLTEQEKWVAEEISRGAAQMAIEDQARNIKDKVARESKPLDTDNVFDLLPTLDELNDVEEDPRFIIMDDAEYTERDARFNHGERHAANLQKELRKIDPTVEVTYDIDDEDDKDVFFFHMFLRSNHATLSGVKDGFFFHKGNHNDETASMTTAAVETLTVAETTKAKAVNFATELAELQAKVNVTQAALLKAQDNHEKATDALNKFLDDTVIELAKKFHPLNPSGKIKIVTQSKGYSFTPVDFSEIYIDPLNCGKQFGFVDWRSRAYARYDTPIQIEKVIGMLKAAIERGDAEFIFPTVDELNQANFTADSLKEVTV